MGAQLDPASVIKSTGYVGMAAFRNNNKYKVPSRFINTVHQVTLGLVNYSDHMGVILGMYWYERHDPSINRQGPAGLEGQNAENPWR